MSVPLPTPIDQALAAAVRAPSPHNTQPWLFEVDGQRVQVLLDRSRVLPVADPGAAQARLACGAAVFNLRTVLRTNGKAVEVQVVPDVARPDLLAVVDVAGDRSPTLVERKLGDSIFRRRTNRRPFSERSVPPAVRAPLVNAAQVQDARLEFIDASARYDALAALVRTAERVETTDDRYAEETAYWTGRSEGDVDGVPMQAAGPRPDLPGSLSLRRYHGTGHLPPRPYERQPLLAALLTRGAGIRFEVVAGMAMQRVLLTATYLGLSTSFVSQPFEVPATRDELRELFSSEGEIHTLLRLGYGYPAPMTARRPASEVTEVVSANGR